MGSTSGGAPGDIEIKDERTGTMKALEWQPVTFCTFQHPDEMAA